MSARERSVAAPACAAAVLAGASALVSAYWTAGGTALLSTVGGALEEFARRGDAGSVLFGAGTVVVKLVGCLLALALARPWARRPPRRLLEITATVAGGFLVLYGGVLVAVGAVALTGVLGTPADPDALRWHVLLWDPWFLFWGLALLLAASRSCRAHRA